MPIEFTGRVAIVTGAGAGLGREYALELARRGAQVVVNDLGGTSAGVGASSAAADQVVAEIRAAGGVAVANHDSVSTRSGGANIVATAMAAFGRVDIVISNAGFLRDCRFEDMTDAQIDAVIDVHLKGAFYVGQPAFAIMKRQSYGRFLFTSSASGMFGHPWQANYAAAKAGLVGLSNVVALEGRDHGILSNALLPGARTRLASTLDFSFKDEIAEIAEVFGRMGPPYDPVRLEPDWVMPIALYLVSEQSATTQGVYSAVSGRYSQVFIGASEGWVAEQRPEPEAIAANWDAINDRDRYTRPISVYHEVADVNEALRRNLD